MTRNHIDKPPFIPWLFIAFANGVAIGMPAGQCAAEARSTDADDEPRPERKTSHEP